MSRTQAGVVQSLLERGSGGPLVATEDLIAEYETALAQDLPAKDRAALLISFALMLQGRRRIGDLVALADEAVELLGDAGSDSKHLDEALAISAGLNVEMGNLAVALNLCLRLIQRDELTPRVKHNFAATLARLGAFAAAARLFAEVVEAARSQQEQLFTVVAALNLMISLTRLELLSNDLVLATDRQEDLDLVDRALRPLSESDGSSSEAHLARLVLAHVPLARGDTVAARDLWGIADATTAHPGDAFRTQLVLVEGKLALDAGDLARVDDLLGFCARHPSDAKALPLARVEIARLKASLHRARGEIDAAFASHRDATAYALQDRVDLPVVLMDEMRSRAALEGQQAILREHTSRLTRESLLDVLTGVPNRRALDLWMVKVRERDQESVGAILLDIDRFKSVNDTFGHLVGDRVLAAVGRLLKAACRNTDFIARFGGEEFVIFPAPGAADEARALAERVRCAFLSWPWSEEGVPHQITASCGVAVGSSAEVDLLLDHADQALYEAKRSGRNAVVLSQKWGYRDRDDC